MAMRHVLPVAAMTERAQEFEVCLQSLGDEPRPLDSISLPCLQLRLGTRDPKIENRIWKRRTAIRIDHLLQDRLLKCDEPGLRHFTVALQIAQMAKSQASNLALMLRGTDLFEALNVGYDVEHILLV